MGIERISDNVYSVGILNPSLRVFDIVMEAKYGTTYNAYLITGSKNVLVETVHTDYFDEYLFNVQSLIDIKDIHYLVMNHTELDHSGSVRKLLKLNPDITIVCTTAAQKYLRAILNQDFNCIVVKQGDTLDIGNTELQFIVAPLLHWPVSMMTYHPVDQVLFSCDFLGCHFCEPAVFDRNIHYREAYLGEFAYYYAGIFGPFKPHVLSGLDKLEGLALQAVCPSHGPVLVEGIRERMADYRAWSTPEPKTGKNILVLYASAYGCTRLLAETAANAISENTQIKAECIDVVFTPLSEVAAKANGADALLIGSTTINRDAPKIIWDVLACIDAINVKGKPAGVFGSYGWSGEAAGMLKTRLSDLKYKVLGDGIKVNFMPDEADLQTMADYAVQVANMVK